MKIGLITERRYLKQDVASVYVSQIFYEDSTIIEPLTALGIDAKRVSWDDEGLDWSAFDLAVFRTPWDYFTRFKEFSDWMDRVGDQVRFLNPIETIRWNLDKRYMLELGEAGLDVVPTIVATAADAEPLAGLYKRLECEELVIKPVVSGGAYDTFRLAAGDDHQELFERMLAKHDMLVQPFEPRILSEGEYSLMVVDGVCTHGVLKCAKAGDYRVQDDHGGRVIPILPSDEDKRYAEKVVAGCGQELSYARVDYVWNQDRSRRLLMELELFEPEMFFRYCPSAGARLARCIHEKLA